MNKTVLGIMGFLLLTPGLVILGIGGVIVGLLLSIAGAGLLVLAIKPEYFKRYLITVGVLFFVLAAGLVLLFISGSKVESPQVEAVQPVQPSVHHS